MVRCVEMFRPTLLTLIQLTWTIWRAPTNASKWRMGSNSAFKGLIRTALPQQHWLSERDSVLRYTSNACLVEVLYTRVKAAVAYFCRHVINNFNTSYIITLTFRNLASHI